MNEEIEKRVDNVNSKIKKGENVYSAGHVINVENFIVEASGLDDVSFYESVNIANKAKGYVFGIYYNKVVIAITSKTEDIKVGDGVLAEGHEFRCSFSLDAIGKVIDIFGNDLIAGKKFDKLINVKLINKPIPIMDRSPVNREFLTGITGIDMLYPIGKGQRQLIIGDKKTGKTQIALDIITNQKDKNVVCMYIALGKNKKEVKEIYYELAKRGASSYTIIVAAFNDDLPTNIYLTPYIAMSVAENLMIQGYDVVAILDDLKKHASVYREISLASKKAPGRDAYPSDIFYAHARLLECGAQHKNGGSLTVLPITETKNADITDYISTNIISICDGQIVLSAKNFNKGQKPAINYGLSVSRIGGAAQSDDVKKVGAKVRQKLLSYLDVREVYELSNEDEMPEVVQNQLHEGEKILDALNQYKFSPKSKKEMLDSFSFIDEGAK